VQEWGTCDLSSPNVKTTTELIGQTEVSQSQHDRIEGIMMLPDDKRSGSTLLIGLSWGALQHLSRIIIRADVAHATLASYWLVADLFYDTTHLTFQVR